MVTFLAVAAAVPGRKYSICRGENGNGSGNGTGTGNGTGNGMRNGMENGTGNPPGDVSGPRNIPCSNGILLEGVKLGLKFGIDLEVERVVLGLVQRTWEGIANFGRLFGMRP